MISFMYVCGRPRCWRGRKAPGRRGSSKWLTVARIYTPDLQNCWQLQGFTHLIFRIAALYNDLHTWSSNLLPCATIYTHDLQHWCPVLQIYTPDLQNSCPVQRITHLIFKSGALWNDLHTWSSNLLPCTMICWLWTAARRHVHGLAVTEQLRLTLEGKLR